LIKLRGVNTLALVTDVEHEPAADVLAHESVSGLTRLSAVETVRARILLAIELGLLKPGERLPTDAEVAGGLDVSAITARRALEGLAAEGVLVRRRGRHGGTFVETEPASPGDVAVSAYRAAGDEVHRLIDERLLMESAVAHEAALRATPDDLAVLRRYVQAGARAESWAAFHAADRAFHRAVAEASRLAAAPRYVDVLERLYRYFVPYPIEFLRHSNDQHRDLVDALERRDPVAAVDITRQHVGSLHDDMFVSLGHRNDTG
jgi:GntR family transcriptional repressor for pyruvate dehydrogenase complex